MKKGTTIRKVATVEVWKIDGIKYLVQIEITDPTANPSAKRVTSAAQGLSPDLRVAFNEARDHTSTDGCLIIDELRAI